MKKIRETIDENPGVKILRRNLKIQDQSNNKHYNYSNTLSPPSRDSNINKTNCNGLNVDTD